jgi:hypothetical protein
MINIASEQIHKHEVEKTTRQHTLQQRRRKREHNIQNERKRCELLLT